MYLIHYIASSLLLTNQNNPYQILHVPHYLL
nr:MAG TPA: hypothetical protein [Bacteriophage sp.]